MLDFDLMWSLFEPYAVFARIFGWTRICPGTNCTCFAPEDTHTGSYLSDYFVSEYLPEA